MTDILFIYECKNNHMGGIQEKILTIARQLGERGVLSPSLLTTRDDSRFARAFAATGAEVIASPMRGRNGIRQAIQVAMRYLASSDCRLIQSHMFRESIVGRVLKRRYPRLRHVFRVHTHLDGRIPDLFRRVPFRFLDRMTKHLVDAFVPISNVVADELHFKSGAPRDRIHVVRNGVVAPGDADFSSGGSAPLPPAVAVVGDLMERKQQLAAVRAVGALHARGFDVNLHIIGEDRENVLPVINATAQDMAVEKLVHIHGYLDREHLGNVLENVSVVTLPSLFEGTPTSIIEGMAMRKVVITTPVGGTPEFVKDGVNGFLHSPRDEASLIAILDRVLTTPASQWNALRDRAHQTWRDLFSLDSMIGGLQAVYRDLGII